MKYHKKGFYEFNIRGETSFQIQMYNTINEEIKFLKYSVRNGKVIFYPGENESSREYIRGNFIIQVEGHSSDGTLLSWAETRVVNEENVDIFQTNVKTNSKFENVITWKAKGNIDKFIITKLNPSGVKLLGQVSHRKTKDGYMYCIDAGYRTKRYKTKYTINAVDTFGKIISSKEVQL